jgi:hypothetical protein
MPIPPPWPVWIQIYLADVPPNLFIRAALRFLLALGPGPSSGRVSLPTPSLSGSRTIPTWWPDRCKYGADSAAICSIIVHCSPFVKPFCGSLGDAVVLGGHYLSLPTVVYFAVYRHGGLLALWRLRWPAHFVVGGGILDRRVRASRQHHSGKVAAPEFCGRQFRRSSKPRKKR